MQAETRGTVRQATVEAVVVRCTCGDPASHVGQLCPFGRREDLGVVAYYHRSRLRRWAWRLRRRMKDEG